jgi:hypothetical protein
VVGSRHLAGVHGMTLADYPRIVEREHAGRTDRELPDGTPYFGKLGEMAYDPDTDLVQCHLCGQWQKWVGGMHRRIDWRGPSPLSPALAVDAPRESIRRVQSMSPDCQSESPAPATRTSAHR